MFYPPPPQFKPSKSVVMSIWELFLTAVALSMDAMAVAVSAGLSNAGGKGVKFREAGLMGLFFGVFQAVMPLLGYYWLVGY